jgi:hypothetical protein
MRNNAINSAHYVCLAALLQCIGQRTHSARTKISLPTHEVLNLVGVSIVSFKESKRTFFTSDGVLSILHIYHIS